MKYRMKDGDQTRRPKLDKRQRRDVLLNKHQQKSATH